MTQTEFGLLALFLAGLAGQVAVHVRIGRISERIARLETTLRTIARWWERTHVTAGD